MTKCQNYTKIMLKFGKSKSKQTELNLKVVSPKNKRQQKEDRKQSENFRKAKETSDCKIVSEEKSSKIIDEEMAGVNQIALLG